MADAFGRDGEHEEGACAGQGEGGVREGVDGAACELISGRCGEGREVVALTAVSTRRWTNGRACYARGLSGVSNQVEGQTFGVYGCGGVRCS